MLYSTFCHIDGVSIETEKKLLELGISNWEDFLNKSYSIPMPSKKIEKIKNGIEFSKKMLEENNLNYFKRNLDPKLHYRLVNLGKIAFVDIETTGLSRYTDSITMIGIYDDVEARTYINGKDLEEAYNKLDEFDIIVTFNGKSFDIPFIEHHSQKKYDFIHLDLRYLLKEFGLSGGLKKIEKELGIIRDDEIQNVDGYEAVRLWKKYQNGDLDALRKLLKYNQEDIINLKYLLNWYLEKKQEMRD